MSTVISHSRAWLSRPIAYTICAPLLTITGAATTIAAPILLTPAGFSSFILLMSVYQYMADFDLGLARLADRMFSRPSDDLAGDLSAFITARLVVAGLLVGVIAIAAIFAGWLTTLAGIAGVAFMLSNGPTAYYRASLQILPFTLAAVLMQIGFSLPRIAGLLVGGVGGCMLALAVWYVMTAVMLHQPFIHVLWHRPTLRLRTLFVQSLPLCVFSSLWSLYLLSNRWVCWSVSSASDAGLFGFGANLVVIGVGVITLVAQSYYPRHLTIMDRAALYRELRHLLTLITGGTIVGLLFCRLGLGLIFPQFSGAASSSAVLLISGVPLCLSTWLIPLVIARSERPWLESLIMFGIVLSSLYAMMQLGSRYGIVGQAWGCIPPALVMLGLQLHLVAYNKFLLPAAALRLWGSSVLACGLVGAVWYVTF